MRVVVSLVDAGELRLVDVPPAEAGNMPPDAVCVLATGNGHGAVIVVRAEQLLNLAAQIIEYVPTTDEESNESQPTIH